MSKWIVKTHRSQSRLTWAWNRCHADLLMAVEMCNMRGDDIYNTNQITINTCNDLDKVMESDMRLAKGFHWHCRINQELDRVELVDMLPDPIEVVITIEKEVES